MRLRLVSIVWALIISVAGSVAVASSADDGLDWAPVEYIPFYDDESAAPIIIVDGARVHAFNSVPIGDEVGVIYSSWQPAAGWSAPVDIILSPLKQQARVGGVHLDADGVFHLVFFGGDDLGANIYYTQAPVANVRQASAWTEPVVVGREAITPSLSSIIGINEDELIIIYSGDAEGQGLYFTRSEDRGLSWTSPEPFSLTFSSALWPDHLVHTADERGRVHLAWAVANISGNGEAVYYTSYDNRSEEFKRPIQLAEAIGAEADTPLLFEYDGELFAVYHNDVPTTQWVRRSRDGGDTWTEPARLHPGYVGSNGPPTVVIDSQRQLHMFFANRTGSPEIHGVWHRTWDGSAWSAPEAVISGPRVQGATGGQGFDPSGPKAVLVQGRTVLLMWSTDPGAGLNGVWHTHADLGIPLEPQASASPVTVEANAPSTPTTTPLTTAQLDATRPQPELTNTDAEETPRSQADNFILGLIPVVILVSVVLITTITRTRRYR